MFLRFCFALASFLLLAIPKAAADVTFYDIVKTDYYDQTSNSAPSAPVAHGFFSRVFFESPSDLAQVQTTYGGSESPLSYDVSNITATYISPSYGTPTARDAAFPQGANYLFEISGGNLGTQTALLQASNSSLFSGSTPYFTGNTFEDLQNMDPDVDLMLTFNSHQITNGANQAVTFITIHEVSNGAIVFVQGLGPNETQVLIPADTLQHGTSYSAHVMFANRVILGDAGFGTATSIDDYLLRTRAPFSTRSVDPVVITADSVEAVLGTHIGGQLSDVDESDDAYLKYRRGNPVSPLFPSIWLEFAGTLHNDNPSAIDILIESQVNDIQITQKIEAFNFNTGQFELVDIRLATRNTDSVAAITLTGDLTRFVEPGTGLVNTKLTFTQGGSGFLLNWRACIDQMIWRVQ